jgi:hypothetical protein
MARKPFKKIKRNPPPNSRFNWDMLDTYRYKNEVLLEAREKVRNGEMTPEQARTWLQDEVEAATGHRPEVNKGRVTAAQKAQLQKEMADGIKENERIRKEEDDRATAAIEARIQAEKDEMAAALAEREREKAEAAAARSARVRKPG